MFGARHIAGKFRRERVVLELSWDAVGVRLRSVPVTPKKMLAALARLARKRYVPSFYWVAIYTGLGDIQKALEYLKKARDERCDYLVYLPKEPAADPIRNTPEFAQLVPRPRHH